MSSALDDLDAIQFLTEALFMACGSNTLEPLARNALQSLVNEISMKQRSLYQKIESALASQEGGAA